MSQVPSGSHSEADSVLTPGPWCCWQGWNPLECPPGEFPRRVSLHCPLWPMKRRKISPVFFPIEVRHQLRAEAPPSPSVSSSLPATHGDSRRESSCAQAWHKTFPASIGHFAAEMKIPGTGKGPGIGVAGFQFRTPSAAFWGHCKSTEGKLLEFLQEEKKREAASVLFYCF